MKLAILILEDEPEVRTALERDLISLLPTVRLEPAQDVRDAWEAVAEIQEDGDVLALALCDHRLPGESGVDFLVQMMGQEHTKQTRKVLVTGQADLSDTVRAVNRAHLDHYMAKPWDADELLDVVTEQLSQYVIKTGINPVEHLAVLDIPMVMDAMGDFNQFD